MQALAKIYWLYTKRLLAVQGAPKLKVAIVGSGLAGLSTAVELLDQGYEVDIYESRPWVGGKVASFKVCTVALPLDKWWCWVLR